MHCEIIFRLGSSTFSIDDRSGNVVTTVALFLIAASVLYFARGAFFVLLLSLFFAYLLEPAVALAQQHSRLGRNNRTWAIAQVYLVGTFEMGILGYEFGPRSAVQLKSLNAALPQILQGLSTGKAAELGAKHGLSAADQQRVQGLLASNRDFIARVFERAAGSAAYVAESTIWLFAIPMLAIFILRDGHQLVDEIVETLGRSRYQTGVMRILQHVDTMLAKYIRAQLALAGLSFVFYSISMLILGFPYAITWCVGRRSGISSGGGMDRFSRGHSNHRLPDACALDLDGRFVGPVETGAGLCELVSHYG